MAIFGFIKKRNRRADNGRLKKCYEDNIVHLDEYDKSNKTIF